MDLVHRFGRFDVHVAQRRLLVDGAPARLGARAFDVLLALIERRDRVVTKDELLDAAWAGLVVEENNLTVQVSTLRKVLGGEVITTIPGRGYRFTASFRDETRPAGAPLEGEADAVAALGPIRPLLALIGREDELITLRALVEQHRVVSVVGAGGIGKTHLVRHLLTSRTQDACFVDLSGMQSGHDAALPLAVASALGIQLGPGDAARGLADAIASREMLLALDNVEHLVEAVAGLARQLVSAAPGLHVVVTSQVPLGIEAERVFRLGCLALPDGPVDSAQALTYSAVAFFVDRAQAADRRFALDDDNVQATVDVCRQLDGLALAIELAAARVQALGLRGLGTALEQRFRILTRGHRFAAAHQQTLHAALDWSHELLARNEQIVFRRLGVFISTFALDTAQRVAADDSLDEWAVLDALVGLVDRSLVVPTDGDPPRYRMLDTPRAYAREKLQAAGEESAIARRHALALRDRLWRADESWLDGSLGVDAFRDAARLDLLDARAALAWAVQHEPAAAVALAPCLDWAMINAPGNDRRALWDATLPLVAAATESPVIARWRVGWHQWATLFSASLTEIRQESAIDEIRRLDEPLCLYWMLRLRVWSLAAIQVDVGEDVIGESDRCIAEMRALERPGWSAAVRCLRARAESEHCRLLDDLDGFSGWLHRAIALATEAGDSRGRYSAMVALVDAELHLEQFERAVRVGVELVDALRSSGFDSTLCFARSNLVLAYLRRGDLALARTLIEEAWPLLVRFGLLGMVANGLALLAALEGRSADAARLAGFAEHENDSHAGDRQSNEVRAVRDAERIATAALGDRAVAALKAEGASIGAGEVRRLAVGGPDQNPHNVR